MNRGRTLPAAAAALAMFATTPLPAQSLQREQPGYVTQVRDSALEAQLRAIVANSGGRIGIYAAEIDGPRLAAINPDHAFPMASTMKIAVAAAYLQGVDEGRLRLDTAYPLRIGTGKTGPDGRVITREGMSLTAQSLIELMISKSDNHATDAIL